MDLDGATALVTGSNRGMGRHFALQLMERGATVYATARRPELVDVPGARVLRLDITDEASARAAAEAAPDVDVVINNAAFTAGGDLVAGDMDAIRAVMESSYFGTLNVVRAFAPVLARNGGGAILNVLSVTAWASVLGNTSYAAAKSAEWGLTNGIRLELEPQRTQVSAFVPGLVATETLLDYAADHGVELPADAVDDPADAVRLALDGLAAGELEVVDALGAQAKAALAGPPQAFAF
jgi:NAD(P)-dependent dehydrogenase (short-subunit alcohol dehydrogenase family)